MATIKQHKTAEIMVDNGGITPILTKGDILAQVGYSDAVVKNPSKVFDAQGFKQSVQELLVAKGIDKQSRLAILSEIMTERKTDGKLTDKRSVIEANKEITKMVGEYEQVQRVQEMESDQDGLVKEVT